MLDSLYHLFAPSRPRCSGRGSKVLAERRKRLDDKYTARPLDRFPNHLVDQQDLVGARAEADAVEVAFRRYKREARCLGYGDEDFGGRALRKCVGCGRWTCNVSHPSICSCQNK